jgi:hypothetical protein
MHDSLLFALSSLGQVSVSKFDQVYGWLLLNSNSLQDEQVGYNFARTQTLRFLDALGHCEYDFGNRRIQVCKPRLVAIPSIGLHKYVLVGARTPRLLELLKSVRRSHSRETSISTLVQYYPPLLIPSVIILESVSTDTVRECANELRIGFMERPASWLLLNYSASCSEYESTLEFKPTPELNWAKRIFDPASLQFKHVPESESFIKLFEYVHPITQQRLHLLWINGSVAEVERDWGRFIVLNRVGKKVLYYDDLRHILAVPARMSLPRIIARAITLCAGIIPIKASLKDPSADYAQNLDFHLYKSVSPPVAKLIAQKLGQVLISWDLGSEIIGAGYD